MAATLEELLQRTDDPHFHLPYSPPPPPLKLSLYPENVIEVDGVALRKVNPYVMGSRDILGMVNSYSRRGMILEGLTGEEADRTIAHEVFHANQRPNDEDTTRRYTHTEDARLNPYTCARHY